MSQSPNKTTVEQAAFNRVGKISDQVGNKGKPLLDFAMPKTGKINSQDWVTDAEWARIQQQPLRAKRMLYTTMMTIVLLIIWAANANLEEITRGFGKIIPSQKLQVVQSLDGGVIQEILVAEGQTVEKGDLLLRIDATRSQSNFYENEAQSLALRAEIIRLKALTDSAPMVFPQSLVEAAPDIVEREKRLYNSNISELNEQQKILESQLFQRRQALREAFAIKAQHTQSISLLSKELDATRPLLKSGAVSPVELLRLERELNSLEGELAKNEAFISRNRGAITEAQNKIDELKAGSQKRWREELAEASNKLSALQQAAKGLQDVVTQTEIRAPIKGKVQRLLATTVGGVLAPGQSALEIIPTDDTLIVEAKISPKDIAFIHPGQEATIKFSAYDFAIYGGMPAQVIQISADTITDEKDETYYLVKLKNDNASFSDSLEIIPGMTVQADIITGKKTVLEYLFKPILRASSEAMTER
ncbi:HlyD family type I secretion periplasmic adaptor subunit [Thiosulfatimonas sediminis]|uniref:Membrane fusion protein (MFP) family protein n=1 Tax=Thiosulfatimonas sediminis TaxID=2675054 RepID=A0A6F8PUF7_9GAMM|nr:HlyD family type I secretion periplasmic adaptor subunit [Thiosulfatimonas sediminis]BBP45610.1 HlyD family type I secretion periplasmic adaptor subunit [Thiosulfatimonas sediminis]